MVELRKKSAFTLIELLVVVIIVAVLAAVGVPLLSANVLRARTSEVEAGLGEIRTGLRARFAEFGTYAGASGLTPIAANIGVQAGDLTGRFFNDDDYLAITAALATFCAGATGNILTPPPSGKGGQVAGVSRSINQDGTLFSTAGCTAGTELN